MKVLLLLLAWIISSLSSLSFASAFLPGVPKRQQQQRRQQHVMKMVASEPIPSSLPTTTTTSTTPSAAPKVCVITGASQGLGQAMAYELAKYGHKVVVNYYPGCQESAQETVDHIQELGGDGFAVPADCTKPEQIEKMFAQIMDHYGKVDVLINNAGITKDNLVLRMKPEEFEAVINVNLSGDFYVTQAFLQHAVLNNDKEEATSNGAGGAGGARIINIASVVGQIGNPGQANYAASKGGVIGFTKSLAVELAPQNIKVNAVCPGFIESPMTHKLTPEQLEKSLAHIPLRRLGKPSEVAAMVRFLAVDEGADYLTGHCFDVDGGVGIAAA